MMADSKHTRVAFLTLSSDSSAKSFVIGIGEELPEHSCEYVQLSNYDLAPFHMQNSEGYDAVVLLHSVQEGRNSITDVPDGKYNDLLPHLKKKYGADRVAVVVYAMASLEQSYNNDAMMFAFKSSQPTTFTCSNCVVQCNNLLAMDGGYRSKLISFLTEAPMSPPPNPLPENTPKASYESGKSAIPKSTLPDHLPPRPSEVSYEPMEQEVKISTEQNKGVKPYEYYDNAVALLNHIGPDISGTFTFLNDLQRQCPNITFKSLDERSVNSIHRFKAVLVHADKKDFEHDYMLTALATRYSKQIEPKGHLGLLMMEDMEESGVITKFTRLYRIPLFLYSRDQHNHVGESTLNNIKSWFTKDCHLEPEESMGRCAWFLGHLPRMPGRESKIE